MVVVGVLVQECDGGGVAWPRVAAKLAGIFTCIILALFLGDRYLSGDDCMFVELVQEDLEDFIAEGLAVDTVLLFPPVNNYKRLLIHKAVEDYVDLHSFSVGEGTSRQTVVCWNIALSRTVYTTDMNIYRPPAMRGRGRARFKKEHSPSPDPGHKQVTTPKGSHNTGQDLVESPTVLNNAATRSPQYAANTTRQRDTPERISATGTHTQPGSVEKSELGRSSDVMVDRSPDTPSQRPDRRKNRRPDVQVYVPRGRRQQPSAGRSTVTEPQGTSSPSPQSSRGARSSRKMLPGDTERSNTMHATRYDHTEPRGVDSTPARSIVTSLQSSTTSVSHSNSDMNVKPCSRTNINPDVDDKQIDSAARKEVPSHVHKKFKTDVEMDIVESNIAADGRTICPLDGASCDNKQIFSGNSVSTMLKTQDVSGEYLERSQGMTSYDKVDDVNIDKSMVHESDMVHHDTQDNVGTDNATVIQDNGIDSLDTHDVTESCRANFIQRDTGGKFIDDDKDVNDFVNNNTDTFNNSGTETINDKMEIQVNANQYEVGNTQDTSTDDETGMCPFEEGMNASKEETVKNSIVANDILAKEILVCDNNKTMNQEGNTQITNLAETDDGFAKKSGTDTDLELIQTEDIDSEQIQSEDNEIEGISIPDEGVQETGASSCHQDTSAIEENSAINVNVNDLKTCKPTKDIVDDTESTLDNIYEAEAEFTEQAEDMNLLIKAKTRADDLITEETVTDCAVSETTNIADGNIPVDQDQHSGPCVPSDEHNVDAQKGEAENMESESLDHVEEMLSGTREVDVDKEAGMSVSHVTAVHQSEEDPEMSDSHVTDVHQSEGDSSGGEDSWDAMFNDDGECLDPSAMEELTRTVGKVKIQKSKKINYLDYQPKDKGDLDYEAYGHIIEIYDFPAEFQTRDLISAFQAFMSRGFDLKWVDDTHALGIFAGPVAAQDALSMVHPLLKVCPLSQASRQSKAKARRCTEFLKPYKPRPETTAISARRLVAGALGLATNIPKEKRDKERQQLKEAREKRRKDKRNREDIWEFGKCAMDEET